MQVVEFLDSDGIRNALSRILKRSNEFIYLISPYVNVSERYRAIIKDASDLGREIVLVYGKKPMRKLESEWFQSIDGIEVRFSQDLHAKCYMSEKAAVITSMNLYEFSMSNNFEMGIVIHRDREPQVYDEILDEVRRIIRISELQKPAAKSKKVEKESEVEKTGKTEKTKPWNKNAHGYCIRCGTDIPIDRNRPYCSKCMKSWNRYKNPDYVEKNGVCHVCGKHHESSMNDAVCKNCLQRI